MHFQEREKVYSWLIEQLGSSEDVVFKDLKHEDHVISIVYIKSLCDDKKLQDLLFIPFYDSNESEFTNYLESLPKVKKYKNAKETLTEIMNGSVFLYTKSGEFYLLDALLDVTSTVLGEATVETVIQGPQNSLSESVDTNLNLVRYRYPQSTLRVKETRVGKLSQTRIKIIYDEKLVNPDVVKEVELGLNKINIDVLQAAGQLQRELSVKKKSLYPTMMITERPDRITYNLSQGKVVMLINGTPFALIVPAVFYDFMSSMEDLIQSYWISQFIVTLRYIGLFISIFLPAFYVGVTAFNPEFFRVQLALSIAGSRIGVPYPAFIEVILMLLMMELLTEASIRLPKAIGSTATTVGGLILGQAAVEAGLVSNVMIIIVASVAISNFVIPINAMQFAMRVTKYILLLLTTFFGIVGLIIGFVGIIAYLTNLRSYGQPYLKLFWVPSGYKKEDV